jgi:hypothetical protein
MAARRGSILFIALLGLTFFADLVLHPTQTLYSNCSDLFVLLLPYKRFLVHAWQQTGALPLWCPYSFAGVSFAHDISASAFYPLHWPLLLLPEEWLGAALSWLVVLHVIAAGWFMHAYASYQGLKGPGALVAAIGYMFAGKWLLHILGGGHYNMVALAWLPLVLLWLEQAIRRRSLVRATWAGVAFALIVLGAFPYVTLYAGLFTALWTLGTALEDCGYLGGSGARSQLRTVLALSRWAGLGLWVALVAVALGAVQLLPGLESSAQSSRSAGVALSMEFILDGFRSLVGFVGPPLSNAPNSWENRAGIGILWLTLLVLAPMLGGPRARYQTAVYLVLVLFAVGGAAALQWLPGFRLFRLPSRMYLVAALPLALLAGKTTQALLGGSAVTPKIRRRCRMTLVKTTVAILFLAGAFAFTLAAKRTDTESEFHPYWATLLITVPCAFWLLGKLGLASGKVAAERVAQFSLSASAWVAILLIDQCALTWSLVAVRPDAEIYAPSACVRYLIEQRDKHGRILDFNPEDSSANHTPVWPGLPAVLRLEPVRGFNPIDIVRYKEYLQFIIDEDQPLQVLDGMFTGPVLGTFPIKNQALADLLGIRYLVQPDALPLETTVLDTAGQSAWKKVFDDPAPKTFNIISVQPSGRDCGLQSLPPYAIYENQRVTPRAFVVAEAEPLAERSQVLAQLKTTDFSRRVLLEAWSGEHGGEDAPRPTPHASRPFRNVTIKEYLPNRVTLEADPGPAGYLVLTDIWFPGWTCTVDGRPVPIHRANFLFRGIELPPGAHHVVFDFIPDSYVWGKTISLAAVLVVLGICLLPLGSRWFVRAPVREQRKESDAVLC